jgi:hypothetical protein
MTTLHQLEDRKEELLNEVSTYRWGGNEDDVDFKEEYADEYSYLQTELNGVQNQIWKIKYQSREKFDDNQFPIGMKQASSKEALNHLFNKNK